AVAEHAIDLGHVAEARGLDLCGATGDHDAGARPLAPKAADGLAGLAAGFAGDRAGIDHDGVGKAGRLRMRPDDLGLVGVETAAEGDEVDAHVRMLQAAPAAANSAGSKVPAY